MIILLTLISFSCPKPIIINTSKYPWNDHDKKILLISQKRCGILYKDAPCVKLFKKWDKQDYSVICGK